MLFDVTRSELAGLFGDDSLATLPATAFPHSAADTEGASLEREVERIRHETSSTDPLPFQDDETVWSIVGEEIAAGQRFKGNSPGARTLYG
ncbi:hypothetical protein [Streptomyces sp. NPDC057686]|uniref:hypothetical protein n=1 Tax=Streptomyces sp. NPDC057686 TaxID=3346212 RepID=UPI00369A828F